LALPAGASGTSRSAKPTRGGALPAVFDHSERSLRYHTSITTIRVLYRHMDIPLSKRVCLTKVNRRYASRIRGFLRSISRSPSTMSRRDSDSLRVLRETYTFIFSRLGSRPLRHFILTDLEGVAGIDSFEHTWTDDESLESIRKEFVEAIESDDEWVDVPDPLKW